MSDNNLQHHGIKGMKWGKRRYQNKDGSLTPAGEKRYLDSDGKLNASGRKLYAKQTRARKEKEAQDRYEKTIKSIEKNYKRGQNFSSKDAQKEIDADYRYRSDLAKAKAEYKNATKLTPEEKKARTQKALKVGAAVAGTALAAYGAYKLNDYVKTKNCQIAADEGRQRAWELFDRAQSNMLKEFHDNKDMISSRIGHDLNAESRKYINNARKDSFAKAAKNVISYKKSGRSTSYLPDLSYYELEAWYESSVSR